MDMPAPAQIRSGLCSVTFRDLSPVQVIRLAADAGLASIEWGAAAPWAARPPVDGAPEAHVTVGEPGRAAELGAETRAAGLAVASFGSYLGFDEGSDAASRAASEAVLDTATALGAPRVRVWAGRIGSADASAEHVGTVTRRLAACVELASDRGIEVGLEFHGRTLTDTLASTLALLQAVPGVTSYWQPHQDATDEAALADLAGLGARASTFHVFSWWPGHTRLPLAAREGLWRAVLAQAVGLGGPRDALLEFVPGDDPGVLAREAGLLRSWIADAEAAHVRR